VLNDLEVAKVEMAALEDALRKSKQCNDEILRKKLMWKRNCVQGRK
jgi:hypothetical protein